MISLNQIVFRVGHAFHGHPWLRMLVGAAVIVAGVLELIVGAGHGRIVAFGA